MSKEEVKEAIKEQDKSIVDVKATRFSADQTVRIPRDRRTEVIVYGPAYRAGARYRVVVRWAGHQVLTFSNVGDGAVRREDFDPLDPNPTGYDTPVTVTVTKTNGGASDLTGHIAASGGDKHLVWFRDHDIMRDNVVTILMVSDAD